MFEIGGSLREARLKRGLDPADVQKAIRIRDRYLQALEEERWEVLPGDAYVKGFLRTYADFLGLDGNLYVDEYNNRFAHDEELPFVPERSARSGPRLSGTGLLRPVVAIGVLAAIIAAVAAWQLSGSSGGQKEGSPPVSNPTTTATTPTKPKKKTRKHTRPVAAALPTRAVLVASRGDCWLWVRSGSASGPTVYEATLAQGKTLPIDLKNGPVWIDVGDPPSLDVRLGGKLVNGLPQQAGNVLLTRSGLKPA
jgi:cytoskeletal protein RodZ